MKKEFIDVWLKTGIIRNRQKDVEMIKSIIHSAEVNAKVTMAIKVSEDSATLIFREMYESIRQLGDAKWRLLGYEATNHEISLESLKEFDIKEKIKLNFLDRFKKIRHDSNYKGIFVSVNQAKEILDFWNKCGEGILEILKKDLNRQINNK